MAAETVRNNSFACSNRSVLAEHNRESGAGSPCKNADRKCPSLNFVLRLKLLDKISRNLLDILT